MAKDPAFLFYPGDWLGGTMGMTFEEKGAYLELLMMQFHRGHMTTHMIGQTVGQLWGQISHKFQQDEKGLWFNARLDLEKDKRLKYSESRRNNVKGKNQYTESSGHMTTHKAKHMTGHMENGNRNRNTDRDKGVQGEKNPYPTHRDCMEVYSKFYEGQAGVVPKIDAADGKALKTMIAYFRSAVKNKQPDLTEPEAEASIVDSFRYIFNHFDKWQPFHKGRIKLTQISSDLPNIIQSIKTHGTSNNSQQNRNGKGVHHVTPEEAAAALHRLHQEQPTRYGGDATG